MKIAICEDEEKDLEQITALCRKILDDLDVPADIHTFRNGQELLSAEETFHLLILDIEMPGANGIQIKEQFQQRGNNTMILFVTVHDEMMQSAFGIHVFGFIQKKNMEAHMTEILPQAVQILQNYTMINGQIDSRQVIYIDSEHVYSKFHLIDGSEKLMRISLEKLQKTLAPVHFIRIHKSYLVNAAHIKKWMDTEVVTDCGTFPISVRMRAKAKKQYEKYCLEHAKY